VAGEDAVVSESNGEGVLLAVLLVCVLLGTGTLAVVLLVMAVVVSGRWAACWQWHEGCGRRQQSCGGSASS